MHGIDPNIINESFLDVGRFPLARNRRHSAEPEPLYGVSALKGECRAIAKGVGSAALIFFLCFALPALFGGL